MFYVLLLFLHGLHDGGKHHANLFEVSTHGHKNAWLYMEFQEIILMQRHVPSWGLLWSHVQLPPPFTVTGHVPTDVIASCLHAYFNKIWQKKIGHMEDGEDQTRVLHLMYNTFCRIIFKLRSRMASGSIAPRSGQRKRWLLNLFMEWHLWLLRST